jgi:hypothetical protein
MKLARPVSKISGSRLPDPVQVVIFAPIMVVMGCTVFVLHVGVPGEVLVNQRILKNEF